MTEHDHASAPITFAIITCSDTRGMKQDTAGAALEQLIADNGWVCKSHVVVKDEVPQISAAIVEACDTIDADVVLTCGGSGLSLRPRPRRPCATATCPASPRPCVPTAWPSRRSPCSRARCACSAARTWW